MRILRVFVLLGISCCLVACGQNGALYLPKHSSSDGKSVLLNHQQVAYKT